MPKPVIEAKFYETYYFVNIIQNVLKDQTTFLRSLNDFYGDNSFLRFSVPFPRFSAFHCFIEFVIDELIFEANEKFDVEERTELLKKIKQSAPVYVSQNHAELPIEAALRHHGYQFQTFASYLHDQQLTFEDANADSVYDYLQELKLSGSYDELLLHSVREAFFILFNNREALLHFNDMISRQLHDLAMDEIPDEYVIFFAKSGVLKRSKIPKWARRAVFYRDRGRCISCHCDLSGIVSTWAEEHYDHIIPLANGGLNDVTNLQLLCAPCNLAKGHRNVFTSIKYQDWYPLEK